MQLGNLVIVYAPGCKVPFHIQTALGYFNYTIPAILILCNVATQVGFDERLTVQGDWDFVLLISEVKDFLGTRQPVYLCRGHEDSLPSGRLRCGKQIAHPY
jgi:hypothetical protein